MGLDAVELVVDVEEEFGISIQVAECERIRTVADLVALIQSRIEAAQLAVCPTLTSFLLVRTYTREITSNDTLRMRTGTRIVDVLSRPQRQWLWKRLDALVGSTTPPLRRPQLMQRSLIVFALLTFVLAIVVAAKIDLAILPLTLLLAAIIALLCHFATGPFRSDPPDSLSTFGTIARRVAGASVATRHLHADTPSAILDVLRPIVADVLGVDISEVLPDARFVEDLGME